MSSVKTSRLLIPFLAAASIACAWGASKVFRISTFTWETEGVKEKGDLETVTLKVAGLRCRHSSLGIKPLLFGRKDALKIEGYLKVRIFPAPGAGEMEVTFDPGKTSVERIARAIKIDPKGYETPYRVILHVKPDLSSPGALLKTLARALEDSNRELFQACHEMDTRAFDFQAITSAWRALFLEGLEGKAREKAGAEAMDVELMGVIGGEPVPLEDLGVPMTRIKIRKTAEGWKIAEADWKSFRP